MGLTASLSDARPLEDLVQWLLDHDPDAEIVLRHAYEGRFVSSDARDMLLKVRACIGDVSDRGFGARLARLKGRFRVPALVLASSDLLRDARLDTLLAHELGGKIEELAEAYRAIGLTDASGRIEQAPVIAGITPEMSTFERRERLLLMNDAERSQLERLWFREPVDWFGPTLGFIARELMPLEGRPDEGAR